MVVLAQAVITALFRSTFIYICVFRRQIRYGLTKFITFTLCGCSPTFSHKNHVLKQPRGRQQRKHQKSKRTTLHVQFTFWFIGLASLNDRQVKYFNVKFHVGGKHRVKRVGVKVWKNAYWSSNLSHRCHDVWRVRVLALVLCGTWDWNM